MQKIFKDEEILVSDVMYDINEKFPWKSSRFTPFMGHVGFYLYDCGEVHKTKYRHYIKLMVNEMDVSLPQLPIYCPYADFWNVFRDHLDDSLEKICSRYYSFLGVPEIPPNTVNEGENKSYMEGYVIVIFLIGVSLGITFRSLAHCFPKPKLKRSVL